MTVILTFHGCDVGMGDASRGRYTGMLWETTSDFGETVAHVTLILNGLTFHWSLLRYLCFVLYLMTIFYLNPVNKY